MVRGSARIVRRWRARQVPRIAASPAQGITRTGTGLSLVKTRIASFPVVRRPVISRHATQTFRIVTSRSALRVQAHALCTSAMGTASFPVVRRPVISKHATQTFRIVTIGIALGARGHAI